ncbi:MAG: hypothetical protein Q4A83_00775 [Bacillota bacterium]|nr:hypothetical protein [Bacillota bacterium]
MLNDIFEWKKVRNFLQYAVYLILTMLLQGVLFSRISIFGVKGMLMPAAVVCAGMYLGGVKGAVFGIFMGVFTDMGFSENTILFTLIFPAIGFLSGFLSEFYINKNFFTYMVLGTLACAVTALAQLLVAIVSAGAELLPGLLTVLLQTLITLLPMALLYLPFRKRKANE